MRSMIMTGCLWLLTIATQAQNNDRVFSPPVLRDGSGKFINNPPQLNRVDTSSTYRLNRNSTSTAVGGNPSATRFQSLQVQCDPNSMIVNWVAVQQANADRYEIEQTADNGLNWTVAGTVPANRTDFGQASYSFNYNKNLNDVQLRISAINIAGERVSSTILQSPCSNTSTLTVSQNPVYSTTTIRIGSPSATKIKLVLANNSGVVVQIREASVTRGNNQIPLDMSSLPIGYYTLSIQWAGGRQDALNILKQ